ncbi:MAG: sugar transferase [Oscillospiraceae bacterium]|nr:sugar transferase [Oscillospiraceae bacterium]
MYKRNNLKWVKHLDFIVLDLFQLLLSLFLAYLVYNGDLLLFSSGAYRYVTVLLLVLDAFTLVLFDTMHNVMRRGYYVEFSQTVKHTLVLFAALALVLFGIKSSQIYSRVTVALSAVFYLGLSFLTRILWKRNVVRRSARIEKKNMILVCREADVASVLARSNGLDEARFSGVVLTDRDGSGDTVEGLPVVANMVDAADYICREWVDEIFFYPAEVSELEHSPLLEQCRQMALPIHIRVSLGDLGEKSFLEKVNGFNVVTFTTNFASPLQLLLKRMIDILGGLVGSLAALLIMAVVGPWIKRASPGPIIFQQERIGQNGKRFKIYKIRSMYMDADERKQEFLEQNRVSDGMMFKLDFDPRIIGNEILPDGTHKTGIGEFIRSHSLDEFPQFFNVLKGDMSIVGTRPPTVDEWEKYKYHHRARLAFRPGVTGMWQTSGRSNITDFEEVVRLDTEYIEHWSLGLDIRLILKTFQSMFTKDGAM